MAVEATLGYQWQFLVFFSVIDRFFKNDRKKLGEFGYDVRKYRLVNSVTLSFNTIIGQITEMSQRQKINIVQFCLSLLR